MKQITKEYLIEAGIEVLDEKDANGNYLIMRTGKACCNGKITRHPLKPSLNGTYHKWSDNVCYYWIVGFNYNHKIIYIPVHRLYYAWFNGEAPSNMDVDHIDGNSINNDINNLQLLTRKENLARRKGYKCQWQTPKYKESLKND